MTLFLKIISYYFYGDNMMVKIFDFEHEEDLELAVNKFLANDIEVVDIKYQVSNYSCNGEQIYSFSCMILYKQ